MMEPSANAEKRRPKKFNPTISVKFVPRPSEAARDRAYEEWVGLYLRGMALEQRNSKEKDLRDPVNMSCEQLPRRLP